MKIKFLNLDTIIMQSACLYQGHADLLTYGALRSFRVTQENPFADRWT